MTKDQNIIVVALSFIACILILYIYGTQVSDKYGAYTIAKYIRFEGDAEGSTSVFEVYYKDKRTVVDCSGEYGLNEGKFYFVRVIDFGSKVSAAGAGTYGLVPSCILDLPLPSEGWKEIPKCK